MGVVMPSQTIFVISWLCCPETPNAALSGPPKGDPSRVPGSPVAERRAGTRRLSRRGPTVSFRIRSKPQAGRGQAGGSG
jgi:hypothetical protein